LESTLKEGRLWHWQDDALEAGISVSGGEVTFMFSQHGEEVRVYLDPDRAAAIANALLEAARQASTRLA
jgi:hypothetical protein